MKKPYPSQLVYIKENYGLLAYDVLPQKILKLQSPKMRFSAFWVLNLRTKERVFHSRKCSFQFISHTINFYRQ